MHRRLDVPATAPEAYRGLQQVEKALGAGPLPHRVRELVKLRVSQINACAFCIDMHAKEALAAGEHLDRILALPAWRDTPWFEPAERAALALAEAGARLADQPDAVPDDVWDEAAAHFDEAQLGALVVTIAMINAWNRITVLSRTAPAGAPVPTAGS